jgi:2-polyprenyl-3-methyl-5-hydroxy-6-metoxy-1,4-benzoquinol methylase
MTVSTRIPPELHEREAHFHDQWAESTNLQEIKVVEAFEAPVALENQFILRRMGPLKGKRLLDLGAGLGESSVYFALQGAEVTTCDISPKMVELAVRLGERFGVRLEGVAAAAEDLQTRCGYYDYVYIANMIHHVADRDTLFRQIHGALKVGGKFFSCDPLAYNPVINVYRQIATKVRSEDEKPLTFRDLDLARTYFVNVGHREFWIASLALFLKYYCLDRVHPNADRYWKRILKETAGDLWWWKPLCAVDQVLTRVPLLRRLAWNMVMWGEKAN